MVRPFRWFAVSAALFICGLGPLPQTTAVAQQHVPEVPRLFGTFTPTPGVWSEYDVVEKDGNKNSKMRMAILDTEGDAFWYEVLMDDGEHRNVIKMLVKESPNNPENIKRMIMKSGDNPATEMPRDFVAMGRRMAVHMFERRSGIQGDTSSPLQLVEGEERQVTVPAGTFRARHQKIVDAEGKVYATYDYNADVLPFGVVTSDTETTSMKLTGYGKDAKSLISETPVPLSGPPGMVPGMPRGMPPGMAHPPGKKP